MNKDKITINGMEPSNYNSAYFTMLKEAELEIAYINLKATEYACMEDFINHKKALATGVWVLEDVQMSNDHRDAVANSQAANGGNMAKISNTVSKAARKLVETIKKVIQIFIDNAEKFFNENSQWVAANRGKINAITGEFWKDCTITAYPYFKKSNSPFVGNDDTGFKKDTDGAVLAFFNNNTGGDNLPNLVCPEIAKINPDSFPNAAKEFYRNDSQQHDFSDNDAKNFCVNAMNYVMNYKQSVAPQIKNNINNAVNEMAKTGIKESYIPHNSERLYSILEGKSILDSEELKNVTLVTESGAMVVVQEEEKTTQQAPTNNAPQTANNKTTPAASTTQTGGVTDNNNNNAETSSNAVQSRKMKYWSLYWNLQTAKMTIAEECRNSCMRTLRAVLRNAESRNQIVNPQGGTTQPSSPVGSTGEGNGDNYVQGVNVGKTALPTQ